MLDIDQRKRLLDQHYSQGGLVIGYPKLPPGTRHRTNAEYQQVLDSFYQMYGDGFRVNISALMAWMIVNFSPGVTPQTYKYEQYDLREWLDEEVAAGRMSIMKGKGGGIFKNSHRSCDEVALPTQSIDDYVCKACSNNKLSKTEKSCWRCGEPISP